MSLHTFRSKIIMLCILRAPPVCPLSLTRSPPFNDEQKKTRARPRTAPASGPDDKQLNTLFTLEKQGDK